MVLVPAGEHFCDSGYDWKMITSDILKFYIKIAGTVVRAFVEWKAFLVMLTGGDQ